MIESTTEITLWEQFRAVRAVRRRSIGVRVVNVAVVAALVTVVTVPLLFGSDLASSIRRNLPFLGIAVLALALIPAFQLWAVWSYRRNTPSARGAQTYRIDSSGLELAGSLFQTKLESRAFLRVLETREFVLFYFAKNGAYFLPKRALTSAQLMDLRQIAMSGSWSTGGARPEASQSVT